MGYYGMLLYQTWRSHPFGAGGLGLSSFAGSRTTPEGVFGPYPLEAGELLCQLVIVIDG